MTVPASEHTRERREARQALQATRHICPHGLNVVMLKCAACEAKGASHMPAGPSSVGD